MAGPGGGEAGRIKIRVLPDTSNFATSLQRYLDRIERRARIQVKAVADTSGLAADLRQKLSHIRARIPVQAVPDTQGFREEMNFALEGAKPKVQVELEVTDAEIARLRRRLAHIQPPITINARVETHVDRDAIGRAVGSATAGSAGSLPGLFATLAASATTAIPSIAALTAGLAQMAPAAAIAAPALLGLGAAGAALKIGLSGVGDALKGDKDALAKLTPAARDFVKQTRALAPAWDKVHDSIQSALFKGLGDTLSKTAKVVLPVLRKSLADTASGLNDVAQSVLNTARKLGKSGALGKALDGTNQAFSHLKDLPAQMLEGLVKLSIGAAPAFERVTKGIAKGMDALLDKISKGLKSGGLEDAINHAIDLAVQLGGFLKDVGTIFANVFGAAADAGAGVGGIISDIADSLAKLTGTDKAQRFFKDLFETLNAVGGAVLDVFNGIASAALPILSDLMSKIAKPIQKFLAKVGPLLGQLGGDIISALGPVLSVLGDAFVKLLPVVSTLVEMLVKLLAPVLEETGKWLGVVADALINALMPIIQKLPAFLEPIFSSLSVILPLLIKISEKVWESLAPALQTLGEAFGKLLEALGPLVGTVLAQFANALIGAMPYIVKITELVGKLASWLADKFAVWVEKVVVPAIQALCDVLNGDMDGAIDNVKKMFRGMYELAAKIMMDFDKVIRAGVTLALLAIEKLKDMAVAKIKRMAASMVAKIVTGMYNFLQKVQHGANRVIEYIGDLPRRAVAALGSLLGTLYNAGRNLIQGFINGVTSKIQSLKNKLSGITGMLPDWKGPAELDARILTPNGQLLMDGFMKGIEKKLPGLRKQLGGITADLPAIMGTAEFAGAEFVAPRGLQPGDTLTLSPDGRRKFEVFLSDHLDNELIFPADVGRRL